MAIRYCEKCYRALDEHQFYYSNQLDKYLDGKLNTCKQCLQPEVDVFNPDTFLWLLKEVDVPYIEEEWNFLVDKYTQKEGWTSLDVLGRYLSKMKLFTFKNFRYKDTSYCNQCNSQYRARMRRAGEI